MPDWKVTKEYGLFLVENSSGADCFSINLSEFIDVDLFIKDHQHMSYSELKMYVGYQYRSGSKVLDKYIVK